MGHKKFIPKILQILCLFASVSKTKIKLKMKIALDANKFDEIAQFCHLILGIIWYLKYVRKQL